MSEAMPIHPAPAGPKEGPAGEGRSGDLTSGPILGTLLAFTVPTLIANVLQTLNGSINAVWVGRLIGESALAATANANVILFLAMAAVFGLGMATTVRVGQHFGARDIASARRTFGAGVGFCTALALLTGVAGWFWSRPVLHLMATPAGSLEEADAYLSVLSLSLPFGAVSMMLSLGLRGVGDSRTPLYAMILTVILDAVFNPLLIVGHGPLPRLGIAGSALSTALANFAGVVLMLVAIYRRDLPLRLKGAELRWLVPTLPEMRYSVIKGLPMGTQMLLFSSAQLILLGLVNREGLATTAAYSASIQLWNYLQMPPYAIATAVSAMVAQAVGAGKPERVRAVTKVGVCLNFVLTLALAAILIVADRPMLTLFLGSGSEAIPIGEHLQLICTWSFAISGMTMVLNGTMRACGAVMIPLGITFVALYPARLGFYFATHPLIGSEALWWSYPFSSAFSVALILLAYTRGRWRRTVGLDGT